MVIKPLLYRFKWRKISYAGAVALLSFLLGFFSIQSAKKIYDSAVIYSGYNRADREYSRLQDSLDQLWARRDRIEDFMAKQERYESKIRMRYGLSNIRTGERMMGVGGLPTTHELAQLRLETRDMQRLRDLDQFAQRTSLHISLLDSILDRVGSSVDRRESAIKETPSIWPVRGSISSPFGYRIHPVHGRRSFHAGIDIRGARWTPIVAAADGLVTYSGWRQGYGKIVEITHSASGYFTRYAHLADMAVSTGDVVRRGEKIGYLGNTGVSTGPHLHYEVRRGDRRGSLVNPMAFLPDTTIIYD